MGLSAAKYRRLPELFVTGTEVELGDGLVMWMQVLNPFEQDEARHDATVARARLTLALRSEAGSEERTKVEGAFWQDSRERVIRTLVDLTAGQRMIRVLDEIENDPDWVERLDVVKRSEEILSRPEEDLERVYLNQINTEYATEVQRRLDETAEIERIRLESLDTDGLLTAFIDAYLERRGSDVALAEHRITELWYAARVCDGRRRDDETWDHAACEGHEMRVFASKDDVRALPQRLQDLLGEAMRDLNMTARDARFSDRQGSSSASSPLPSEPAASTRSTQDVTPSDAPGTSPQPSPTH